MINLFILIEVSILHANKSEINVRNLDGPLNICKIIEIYKNQ